MIQLTWKTRSRAFVVVHSLSCVRLFVTPWTAAHQASLSFTISQSLLRFITIELMMPSSHLILCRPLLLLPSVFLSIRVFSNESALRIRWPKDWSFSFSPSSDHSGLTFRSEWFVLHLKFPSLTHAPGTQHDASQKMFWDCSLLPLRPG